VKLRVKQSDIDNGERFSLDSCPVGLAAQRSFTGKEIRVGYGHLSVADADSYELYTLPKFVGEMIEEFEKGSKISPAEFQITKVEKRR
jgi:hypothetical protein